jgi:hypothetical protein
MSTTASLPTPPRQRYTPGDAALLRPPPPGTVSAQPPSPSSIPPPHGAITMFRIPFASTMSDPDIAVLARSLDLVTHMHPKQRGSAVSPGLARLDFGSGIFLERGSSDTRWVLEGRTWGHPSPQAVHDWHLRAAAVAHRLDHAVAIPARAASARPGPQPGRAASRRPGGLAQRLRMRIR